MEHCPVVGPIVCVTIQAIGLRHSGFPVATSPKSSLCSMSASASPDMAAQEKALYLPNRVGNPAFTMTETRYYKEKIYVPQEIRKKLRLRDGDLVRFEVAKDGEAKLVVVRAGEATQRVLQRVTQPPNLGHVAGTLRREDLYDDIA